MKEAGISNWFAPNKEATNSSGFSALPGGECTFEGKFLRKGYYACFWSADSGDHDRAWYTYADNTSKSIFHHQGYIRNGYSIRCVKDY